MENSKIYPEIPTCTICLEDLLTDLSTTKCGHVFHTIWLSYYYFDYINLKFNGYHQNLVLNRV